MGVVGREFTRKKKMDRDRRTYRPGMSLQEVQICVWGRQEKLYLNHCTKEILRVMVQMQLGEWTEIRVSQVLGYVSTREL